MVIELNTYLSHRYFFLKTIIRYLIKFSRIFINIASCLHIFEVSRVSNLAITFL